MGLKITYVANHDSGSGDDEGAVHHALTELGHDVQRVREIRGHKAYLLEAELVLFHKWHDLHSLQRVKIPKAFWHFDLIDYPDPTIAARCKQRVQWMADIMPLVDVGFCTDGDWAAKHPDKLVWLPQGADERVTGLGKSLCHTCSGPVERPPILFTGIKRGGQQRESFVGEMKARYGDKFNHVEKGVYGRELANLIAGSKIVVAPDGPVTPNYWSNRVWTALGFGAFLMHPYCERLAEFCTDREEIVYYTSREHLYQLIDTYLADPEQRQKIAAAGLARTLASNLYRHRCEKLIQTVKERLL